MMGSNILARRSISKMSDKVYPDKVFFQQVSELQSKVTELDVIMKNSVDDIRELKAAHAEITKKMDDGFSVILEKITTLTCEFSMLRSKHFWYPVIGSLLLQFIGFCSVLFLR